MGNLNSIRIWHDNSGKGSKASWFLKHIIIRDLTTKEKYYFICENWFAVDQGDGLIERVLLCASEQEKSQLKYLIKKETKQNLSDNHLWFSVLARPVKSSFSRLDRLTCCFVLLCMTMLMNILYYGIDKSSNPNAIIIGPLSLTPEQIGIGIMTNLIIFPPSFLLLQIFRRTRSRHEPNPFK